MGAAYIVAAARTAGGRKGGRLAQWHPSDLAGAVIDDLLARANADPDLVEDVILGCVTQAGQQSLNVARNAILSSRLPDCVPGVSVDRQCGSSQQALHFAAQAVMAGSMDVVIAGGVESMTRVPMGLAARHLAQQGFGGVRGARMEKRYGEGNFSQFAGADMLAAKYGLSREACDAFGFESHKRAARATERGDFRAEISSLPVDPAMPGETHDTDEGIRFDPDLASMAALKPLREGGVTTAGTSSQICDGASGVIVANEQGLKALGVEPIARIVQMTALAGDPVIMVEAVIPATQRALDRSGLSIDAIDLFEVNEAFAAVPLAWAKAVKADVEKLNVSGGAIAIGHPLGASGTKLMTTLTYGLQRTGGRYGLQTMCEGGGMANVTIIERL